ncbi:DMT family protein [uncultured Duncaniella sp.]|uniref:DMT family protein n=1 Tax=uncultured Duncaniella sp. TaxID=2768039 RepID=UPI0026032E8E|nr:DMT family protein [uncultured Duncaniella sp.]
MNGWWTVGLLVVSNIFMTFAWYGQLKLSEMKVITSNTPLFIVILLSWVVALLEYCFMVPANRYGYLGNGGQFSLLQLKVMQEVISLLVFTVFAILLFKGESLHWNHFLAFCLLIAAVYLVFMES